MCPLKDGTVWQTGAISGLTSLNSREKSRLISCSPAVSIVIRTKNEERFIEQTFSSIFKQETGLSIEVIVIDSGSKDRTLDIVRKFYVRLYEIEPDKFSFGYSMQNPNCKGRFAVTKNIFQTAWDYFVFLPKHNYLRYVPILPMYFILKYFYIYKGIKEGKRLYGPS